MHISILICVGSIMCITIKMTHFIVIPIKFGFDISSDESL